MPPNEALAVPSGDSAHYKPEQFGRQPGERASPYAVSTDSCASWNSEWSRERAGSLEATGSRMSPSARSRTPFAQDPPPFCPQELTQCPP